MPGARHVSLSFKTQQALRVYVVLSLLEAFSKEAEEGLWQTAVAAVASGNFFSMPHFKVFFPLTKILKNKLIYLLPVQKHTWSFSSFDISFKGGGGVISTQLHMVTSPITSTN